MKIKLVLFFLLLMLGTCTQQSSDKNHDYKEYVIKAELESEQVDKKDNKRPFKYDPLKKYITKRETKEESDERMKRELRGHIEGIKRSILRNMSETNSFRFQVDSLGRRLYERLNWYNSLDCEVNNKYANKNEFNIEFNEEYKNANNLEYNSDVSFLCLRELILPNDKSAKLIYKTWEGGHYSDEISIVVFDTLVDKCYYLALSYSFGKEGYSENVESRINGTKVFRTITGRFGISNTHPDSLAKQPRRVVNQIFSLDNGGIELVEEQSENFNIDELFE